MRRSDSKGSMGFIMKYSLGFIAAFILAAPLALAQTSTWVPDQAHSEVDFSILHMSLSNVHGRFGNVAGTILMDEADITHSSVKITIPVDTVDTGVGARDSALKSVNFFDTDKFPTATFVSTSVTKTAGGFVVSGNLDLHGETKPVVLQVQGPTGPVAGMDRKLHEGFSAETTLSRTDFGIAPTFPFGVVGDSVKLTLDIEVIQQ